jgi:UDP-galactopyranose mutase
MLSKLSFEFPFILNTTYSFKTQKDEVTYFVNKVLGKDIERIWKRTKYNLYPISNIDTLDIVNNKLLELSKTNIFPMGRMGIYAYVSKDTCVRMAMILSNNLDSLESNKLEIMNKVREKLS